MFFDSKDMLFWFTYYRDLLKYRMTLPFGKNKKIVKYGQRQKHDFYCKKLS